ncbi:hypothetical protein A3J90_05640 [candidate division WOR-1 bacterium RIFOXYC2_FULL_37_10]|uniref:YhcG N-terminal domain-containing protein n=1 Tax=candidate division WOR-1 bacterium RIFOXYB2_FULL_37_13 TaxID=1802579 RepID=A0A1F4SDT1_UNCSA|nr:MAG: hypothetical protein A2310_02130 [candidate division WOR-1 bacterium RIFOXYB2_FULL_37_13]OGC37119.1 MAG: hypothetical protein A3J90_05640 [candidate division WOR-1 bacterium RIFOXYC2_FULL_37_10]
MSNLATREYKQFFKDLKDEIQKRRYKTLQSVNRELIALYWEIGKRIVKKQETSGWGDAIVETLAKDLSIAFPDTKGFSERNLWRMKQYYIAYRNSNFLPTLSAEISWSCNNMILEQVKDEKAQEFYIKLTIKERWSVRESIGLILCKSKNDETVKLAISQAARKMGIATYQTMLPDTKLIEEKLHNINF